ncbi:hypothetical protein KY358_05875 [Candidatus Woesearchaeota archaeon]|nr:hypothetical protein [Candidatus Woesearchaeota archaeon]
MTFLALSILALSVMVFRHSEGSEGLLARLAAADKARDMDISIKKSIAEIFAAKSGISINITEGGIYLEETLPNDNILLFSSAATQFLDFAGSSIPWINLSINESEKLPLRIMPQNILYHHRENLSNIEVMPSSINFAGYEVILDAEKNLSCSWTFDPGSFNLSFEAKGDISGCGYTTNMIDPASAEIAIDSEGEGRAITLTVDNGALSFNITEGVSARARTKIMISQPDVSIIGDSIVLRIRLGGFGVYKESRVTLAG